MVTSSFLPGRGGIESYLAELCDLVSPRLAVLAPKERDGIKLPTDLGYPVHGYQGRSILIPTRAVVRAIGDLADRYRTTKVLLGTPWPLGLLGPQLRARGLSYAVIVHGAELLVPAAVPGLRRRLARSMAGADMLLPVSGFTGRVLSDLIEGSGHSVPPIERLHARVHLNRWRPDIDTTAARARFGLKPTDKVVLCFGRLVKRKGVDRLIKVLPRINERVPDAVVVIAGTGPELGKLKKLAGATPGRVIVAGRIPDEEAPALYALADVFALPVVDRYKGLEIEGLGVVLLEASACGTPCVTGRSGGTPEAVVDGMTGYVIDASDLDELVERITHLLERPELARTMGLRGREHVTKEFSSPDLPEPLLAWLGNGLP